MHIKIIMPDVANVAMPLIETLHGPVWVLELGWFPHLTPWRGRSIEL